MKFKQYFSDKSNTLLPNILSDDVLSSNALIEQREKALNVAFKLGTIYNLESNIEYVDSAGRNLVVIAKVIGLTSKEIQLPNNRSIDKSRISKVVL